MIYEKHPVYPFKFLISFHVLIEQLKEIEKSDVVYRSQYAKALLQEVEKFPELVNGMTSEEEVYKHKDLVSNLLADLFPTALTQNEIKAVAIPYHNIIFNHSQRFKKILKDAGPNFDLTLSGYDSDFFYIMNCCLILKFYYKAPIDFSQLIYYDIPNSQGIIEHYRVLYNADFIEVLPTENTVLLSPQEIENLINNFEDIDLWKSKFLPKSYILKGFGIMSLINSTTEVAISNLKTGLIERRIDDFSLAEKFENVFRSIFKINDLQIGYSALNEERTHFVKPPFSRHIKSFMMESCNNQQLQNILCQQEFENFLANKNYIVIPDIEARLHEKPDSEMAKNFLAQGIQSVILVPMHFGEKMLGLIEVTSFTKNKLNSINAHKLDPIVPYLTESLGRVYYDLNLEMEAIIQKEYTSIHPSVYWKFKEEAIKHVGAKRENNAPFEEIVFNDVIPLYGQIDIVGSSTARNNAVKDDMIIQIDMLAKLYQNIYDETKLPVVKQNLYELESLLQQFLTTISADSESNAMNFIFNDIHPSLEHFAKANDKLRAKIVTYFESIDPKLKIVYKSRRDFDDTIAEINKSMATILDKKQEEAQQFFPHYYERFKTDGVEHNLYIGASIAPKLKYSAVYLNNLKLWQLQVACEMELEYARIKPTLKYDLEVASMLLVFSAPISIRFRMDEKRFDVDGTYNARYEVIKKRIDKSFMKGTQDRITESGKITIVYSNPKEEKEYKKFIQLLHHEGLLDEEIEQFEVEDLQGVAGLKALRVQVKYPTT